MATCSSSHVQRVPWTEDLAGHSPQGCTELDKDAKMGPIRDRKGIDLTEAEDIKKQQEYTEEMYKKGS